MCLLNDSMATVGQAMWEFFLQEPEFSSGIEKLPGLETFLLFGQLFHSIHAEHITLFGIGSLFIKNL